jgi:Tfp pilus assembly protein PilV
LRFVRNKRHLRALTLRLQCGFSLVEIIVSLSILIIVFLSASRMATSVSKARTSLTHTSARERLRFLMMKNATNALSLKKSALEADNMPLGRCVDADPGTSCTTGTFLGFSLLDPVGPQKLSGANGLEATFRSDGSPCPNSAAGSCKLHVSTFFLATCGSFTATCPDAAALTIKVTIRDSSVQPPLLTNDTYSISVADVVLKGSGVSCPAGLFLSGLMPTGQPICIP